ncbi:MAG: Acetolactate synthase large subunit, partial [uncultured Solirubrobacterales bacterium]
ASCRCHRRIPQGRGRRHGIRLARGRQPPDLRRPLRRGPAPCPLPPRGRCGARCRGLRQGERPRRRGAGHERSGGDEPRHPHRRRDARLGPHGVHHRPGAHRSDRHRRLPGGRHHRHHHARGQALDPDPGPARHPERDRGGLPHRPDGAPRPGARRRSAGPLACRDRLRAGRLGQPAGLPAHARGQRQAGQARGQGAGQRTPAGHLRRRWGDQRRGLQGADRALHLRRLSGHLHGHGARRVSGAARAVARHARHARHPLGQLRHGRGRPDLRRRRPLRRPDHRQAVGVRAAGQVHPHRRRPGRDLEERAGAHPDRRRRQAHPHQARARVPRARGRPLAPRWLVGADRRLAREVPARLRGLRGLGDQAAVHGRGHVRGHRRRGDRHLRRRPAPDVVRPVLRLPAAAAVDQLGRARDDGLRPALGHGRSGRLPGSDGGVPGRRRVAADEHPGARHLRDREHPGEDLPDEQLLPGHGPPVAGAVLGPAVLRRRHGTHARLGQARRGLRGDRDAGDRQERALGRDEGCAERRRTGAGRRPGDQGGELLPDDPGGAGGQGHGRL